MKILKKLSNFYWKHFKSNVQYARHIGVHVGEHCVINIKEWSVEPYLVTIGNHVTITQHVQVHTHGGASVARRVIPDFDSFGKVVIEDWAYIGTGSQIMPGVTIGEGSLVAAGSIVTKSVPAGVVVAGNPARFICTVEDFIEKNKKFNLATKKMGKEEKKAYLLSLTDDRFIRKPEIKI